MAFTICVYSSSSTQLDSVYYGLAAELGREIARRGDTLLFGAGMIGLMGSVANAVHEDQGKIIGVIPKALNLKGIVSEICDELIVTEGLRERKAEMDRRSDAFIALPGGYGTLEEILEIITLKQLGYHQKPIVVINFNGFYDALLQQFEVIVGQHFAKAENRDLYRVTTTVSEALDYIHSYRPGSRIQKWW